MLIRSNKAANAFAYVRGEYLFCDTTAERPDEVMKLYALCNLINTNKEVKTLLLVASNGLAMSLGGVYAILQFTHKLLTNFKTLVENGTQKRGLGKVIKRDILKGAVNETCWSKISKLQENILASSVTNRLTEEPYTYTFQQDEYFNNATRTRLNRGFIGRIIKVVYIENIKTNLNAINNCNVEAIEHAIKEVKKVINFMKKTVWKCSCSVFVMKDLADRRDKLFYDTFGRAPDYDAIRNTQTLTLNRPKQQENKIITVGNKKAYQVGKGDYKHRNGVIMDGIAIKEEKAEMNKVYTYPVGDKNILADLEDLLNNIIDNPDTVDNLVNYLEKNAPAAHFISEMIGCGEIDSEESLIGALNKATSVSQGMVCAGKNVNVQGGEYKVFNYLNIDYPKPIFGREFSLKQLSFCFDVAAREIEDIFVKAKEEEEAEEEALEEVIADAAAHAEIEILEDLEEKEEVTANDTVQEHAEEDCEPHTQDIQDYDDLDFEELTRLMEERQKKEAELDAELAQAEEEKRKELIAGLRAADKRIEGKEARLAKLREK